MKLPKQESKYRKRFIAEKHYDKQVIRSKRGNFSHWLFANDTWLLDKDNFDDVVSPFIAKKNESSGENGLWISSNT